MLLLGLVWDCSRKFFPCDRLVKRSVSRRNVREHAERQFGIAWRGRGDGYDPKALAERPQGNAFGGGALVRRSVSRPRRARHGGACSVVGPCPEAKRRVRCSRRGRGFLPRVRRLGGLRRLWGRTSAGFDAPASGSVKTDRPLRSPWQRLRLSYSTSSSSRATPLVVPTVQQGLPLLLRSVVHDDEPVREGLHRRIAVPLG